MLQKLRASFYVGLLCLMSPLSYAHVDGAHHMPLLDGLLHFISQPSHLSWVILAVLLLVALLYRSGHSLPRVHKSARFRKTRDE